MADDPFADLVPGAAGGQQPDAADPFADLVPQQQQQAPVGKFWSSKAGRVLQGMEEPAIGLGQLAAHITGYGSEYMDRKAAENEAFYQRSRAEAGLKPEDWDYWAGAGNIASPVNYIPGGVISKVVGPAKTLMGLAGRGAVAGAGYGAMQPVTNVAPGETFTEKKGEQVGAGALTGGFTAPALGLAAKVVKPAISEAAQKLLGEGVELTPGQILGGKVKRIESVAASAPLVGQSVRAAQEHATETFNTAAANRALAPIGESVPKGVAPGHAMIEHVEDALSSSYNQIHSQLSMVGDAGLKSDLQSIFGNARTMIGERLKQFHAIVDEQINEKLASNNGQLDGSTIQSITSELGRRAGRYSGDASVDIQELGRALGSVRDAFSAALERQNPALAPQLQATNLGWANYARLRQAAGSTASQARGGVFTPTQLGMAARQMDRTAGKGASAKGEALMQDLAEAGRQVLPSSVPDSGTPERLMTHGLLHGTAAYMAPQTLVAYGMIPLLYSRAGQSILRAAITKRPESAQYISELIRKYAPTVGARSVIGSQGENQ